MSETLRMLHLEDDTNDALLVQAVLERHGLKTEIRVARSQQEFMTALSCGGFDVILADIDVAGFDGKAAFATAREQYPGIPFVFVSALPYSHDPTRLPLQGQVESVLKTDLESLGVAIRRAQDNARKLARHDASQAEESPADRLISAVQELSLARDLPSVMAIVRSAARSLTGADGATFILRDGNQCYYADENAIGPLWKGKRFPMSACISGWVMLNKRPAVIQDIYADPRIPADAYRPTFVKSLAVVPIRAASPVGAIGNYWATHHRASDEQVKLLQALADSASIALENVQLYNELEQRVSQRTEQLQAANRELEAFSYSVSHDLRAPLRSIEGFSRLLVDNASERLDADSHDYIRRIQFAAHRMGQLIEDLLGLSRLTRHEIQYQQVDLSAMVKAIAADLMATDPERQVEFDIQAGISVGGDPRLLRIALENLLSNAWKYTALQPQARIRFGRDATGEEASFYVQDNGAGFDMAYAGKLFGPFQRLHSDAEFPGTGVGLATVQRIIHRHGGRIWAQAVVGEGATFTFTLGSQDHEVRDQGLDREYDTSV